MRCQLGPAKHDLYHHQSNHVFHGYYLTEVLTQWFQMMHRIIDNLLVSILCCLKRQNSDKLSFQQASIAIHFLTNISSSVFICAGICTYTTLFSIHHNKCSRHLLRVIAYTTFWFSFLRTVRPKGFCVTCSVLLMGMDGLLGRLLMCSWGTSNLLLLGS